MRLSLFLICGMLLAPAFTSAQFTPDTTGYLWPTDASPYLSGTFGETRSEHFHAALDIKTWGRRGYDVYATRDGTLHRIAIGPGGYGKAIYLKHADGSYSVYAHLLSFEDQIQQLADSIRFRNYAGKIDVTVDSMNIAIERGELIGYSGATGIGPPHLHFELRTPSERPFNPLLTNLSIPDDRPPQFSGLSVEPLSPNARIEGENKIYLERPTRTSGSYDFGSIQVQGPVGLGVELFDQANNVTNAYAVYDLKLKLGDELLFHSQADSFSYDETSQMFLDRVYPLLKQRGIAYQRLYITDGNTLPFYKSTKNRGRLNLPEGNHQLTILAEDYSGNRSEAQVTLEVKPPTEPPPDRESYSSINNTNRSSIATRDAWSWHSNWINFNGIDSLDYTVISLNRGSKAAYPEKVSPDSFLILNRSDLITIQPHRIRGNNDPIHLQRLLPADGGRIYADGIRAYATFPGNALYDTLSLGLTGKVHAVDSVQIELHPNNEPLKGDFELTYILNERQAQDTTMAFYELEKRRNRLKYIPTRKGGPVLKGEADKLGRYYVLSDTTAPDIRGPRILRRADGTWMGMVQAEDYRSGIDHTTAEFYINGVRGIAEFEPEDDRILYYHPDFEPTSEYEFRIVVSDMVGNRTEQIFRLN